MPDLVWTLPEQPNQTARWEEASGGGGGGGIPDPVTETVNVSPATDEAALVLTAHAGSGQQTLVFQVFDEEGDLSVDIDSQGILDVRKLAVQDPPDTGNGNTSVAITPGRVNVTALTGNLFEAHTEDGTLFQVKNQGSGSGIEINQLVATDSPLVIVANPSPSGDMIQVWNNAFDTVLFAVTATGGIRATLPGSNPGPGLLWNNGGVVTVGT